MKIKPKWLDYVTKDYEGFRQLMVDLIPIHTPEWTDTSQTDFGIVLIELLSYSLDILSYYQDKSFNESLLPTALTLDSVRKITESLGYKIQNQTPARVMIEFTKHEDFLNQDIMVLKNTRVCTYSKDIIFETDEDLVIPSGQLSASISATHGYTHSNDILGKSNGEKNQSFQLSFDNVIDGTIRIFTEDANKFITSWDEVDSFILSKFDDLHYRTSRRGEFTFIHFSDGFSAKVPPFSEKVIAQYRSGGGTIGNVGSRTLTKLYDTPLINGIISITNPLPPYVLGRDIEDIEHAKYVAPRQFRTMSRAVSKSDFEDLALTIAGVSKAAGEETFNANKDFNLYIVPDNYGVPSQELKDLVYSTLSKVMVVNNHLHILNPTYKEFTISAHILVSDSRYRNDVISEVNAVLLDVFNIKYMDFKESLKLSTVISVIRSVDGVEDVTISSPASNISCGDFEVLKLTGVTITGEGGVLIV